MAFLCAAAARGAADRKRTVVHTAVHRARLGVALLTLLSFETSTAKVGLLCKFPISIFHPDRLMVLISRIARL
jgi:hypothetical protein